MTLIPIFILILGAILLWVTRGRNLRTQWGLSVIFSFLTWLLILVVRLSGDASLELSVWQPSDLFRSSLSLSLDSLTWPIAYALVTVLLSMVLTSASRESLPSNWAKVFWFVFTAGALVAILADNLLTIVITWTMFDFMSAIFLFGLLRQDSEIRQVLTRLSIDLLGVILVLAGAAISIRQGGAFNLEASIPSSVGAVLLGLGGLVRLGLLPLHFNLPGVMVARRGIGTLMRYYPPAIALTFLAKIFRAGLPSGVSILFVIAGLSGLIIGGIRWLIETDPVVGRPFLILTLSGTGILASSLVSGTPMAIVATTVVLLLAGAVLSLAEIFTPTHRAFALGAAIIHLGLPWLPLGLVFRSLGEGLAEDPLFLILALIIVLGLVFAILGCLHSYFIPQIQWRTGENLVRISYGLGLSIPVLTSVGIGVDFNVAMPAWGWAIFGVQLALTGGGFLILRNLPEGRIGLLQLNLSRMDPSSFYALMGRFMNFLSSGFQAIAALIEGEAALLWIFAISVFIILAST